MTEMLKHVLIGRTAAAAACSLCEMDTDDFDAFFQRKIA